MTATVTLNVRTFPVKPPAHVADRWSPCLCDHCWRQYLDYCDRQDGTTQDP